jgi:hypothetical protein
MRDTSGLTLSLSKGAAASCRFFLVLVAFDAR